MLKLFRTDTDFEPHYASELEWIEQLYDQRKADPGGSHISYRSIRVLNRFALPAFAGSWARR